MNNQEQKVFPMGNGRIDYSSLFAEPLIDEKATGLCEYELYHLPSLAEGCSGPGQFAYGHGALVSLCEKHYASAPDPRRIPMNWDGNPKSLLSL